MLTDDEWKCINELDAQVQFNEVANSSHVNWGQHFLNVRSQFLGDPLPAWHTSCMSESITSSTIFTFGLPVNVGKGGEVHCFIAPPGGYTKVCPMLDRDWDLPIFSCVHVIGGLLKCSTSFAFCTVASILECKTDEHHLGEVHITCYADDAQEFPNQIRNDTKKVPDLLIGLCTCTSAEIECAVKTLGVNPDNVESIMHGGHPCFIHKEE